MIPHFLYWLPWCGALSVFAFINLRYPIQYKVSQDPKESHTQIQSARSRWGTRMNSSTEGPDTSFADILVENHLCLILRQSLFQQINIVWLIINKCINHYYQSHKTLSISRSPSLNNFRHYDWKYCCWGPLSLVYKGYLSICRESYTETFYKVVENSDLLHSC